MKKVIMYLGWNYNFGVHYHWHEEREYSDWDPYFVEIPEDFSLCESRSGKMMYYRGDDLIGYKLTISQDSENGYPVLVGGSHTEMLTLNVLGAADEK